MEGIPTPLENPIFLLLALLEAKIPQEWHCSFPPKKIIWNAGGFSTLPGVTRRCHRCPQGVSMDNFPCSPQGSIPTLAFHLFPEFSLIPFHRGLHSPALVSPAAPSPRKTLGSGKPWSHSVFQLGKRGFHPRIPTGIIFGGFLEVLTKKLLWEFMGLSNVTLGKDPRASPTARKSKGISLPDHLQQRENFSPFPKEGKKPPDLGRDPKSRREQGREGHQEMSQPTDGVGWDGIGWRRLRRDSARPTCPAPN